MTQLELKIVKTQNAPVLSHLQQRSLHHLHYLKLSDRSVSHISLCLLYDSYLFLSQYLGIMICFHYIVCWIKFEIYDALRGTETSIYCIVKSNMEDQEVTH